MTLSLAAATLGAGALGAAGGAAGSIYAANKSASSAKKANALNAIMAYALQERQENFEKWKLANSYQETMKDMKKAGLNPILGMTQNGATSAGSIGSSFAGTQQGDFSSLGNIGNSLNMLGESVKTAKQLDLQENQINADTYLKITQALGQIEKNKWISPTAKKSLELTASQITKNASQTAKTNLENQFARETMGDRIAQEAGKAEQELSKGYIGQDSQKFLMNVGLTKEQISKMTPLQAAGIIAYVQSQK